jgi:hypothetical protein
MNTVPVVRELSSQVVEGYSYRGPAALAALDATGKAFNQTMQLEFDEQFFKSYVTLGGLLFHLPAAQVNRAIDGMVYAEEEGEVSPTVFLFGKPKQ